MAHAVSEPEPNAPHGNGDRDNGDRPAAPSHPLGERCPDDLERLWRFTREHLARRRGASTEGPVLLGLDAAARRIVVATQQLLAELEPRPVPLDVAERLALTETSALFALAYIRRGGGATSPGRAKQLQVELAGGRPLAVCVGTRQVGTIETSYGPREYVVSGCGAVFPASTRPSGRVSNHWCPDCRRNLRRNPAREARRTLKRQLDERGHLRESG